MLIVTYILPLKSVEGDVKRQGQPSIFAGLSADGSFHEQETSRNRLHRDRTDAERLYSGHFATDLGERLLVQSTLLSIR